MLSLRFKRGGSFAWSKLSTTCWALSPNALPALFLSSSRKSERDFVLGSSVSLFHLCLAVACDPGLTSFRRNTINT